MADARPIREIVAYFLRLRLLSFGGPVVLVGQMERGLVSESERCLGLTRRPVTTCRDLARGYGDCGLNFNILPP